jgi:hypothetical protein
MFTFRDIEGSTYKVGFRHHRKTKSGKTMPKATTCIISQNGAKIAEAQSMPIGETLVIVESVQDAYSQFGRRVKTVAKTVDGRFVATLRGDNFCYATGREEAMTKALMAVFPREDRTLCWKAYNKLLDEIAAKAEEQSVKDTVEEL